MTPACSRIKSKNSQPRLASVVAPTTLQVVELAPRVRLGSGQRLRRDVHAVSGERVADTRHQLGKIKTPPASRKTVSRAIVIVTGATASGRDRSQVTSQ